MSDIVDLRKYAVILRRWLWLVVLISVAFAAGAYYLSSLRAPVFEARSTVVVGELNQSTSLSRADVETSEMLARTYADMALRFPVLDPVARTLEMDVGWLELRDRVQVVPVEGTQLLEVIGFAGSIRAARELSNAVAAQLVALGPDITPESEGAVSRTFVNARLIDLRSRIEEALQELDELNALVLSAATAELRNQARTQVQNLQSLISTWENSYVQMLTFLQTDSIPSNTLAVFEPAQAVPDPVRPKPYFAGLIGGLLGFLVAMGGVSVIGLRDETIRLSTDIDRLLRLPVLGTVGHIPGKADSTRLITAHDTLSRSAEDYRIIRSNIEFRTKTGVTNSIVVTSAEIGEGKSLTAANLSIVMAKAGLRTVLVDADLRRSTQRQLFDLPSGAGLTDVIHTGGSDVLSVLQSCHVPNLRVVTSGRSTNTPSELLRSQGMREVLDQLRRIADVVILDSPPVNGLTDAHLLANRADSTILVVRARRTRARAVRRAVADLMTAEADLLGVVVNLGQPGSGSYYVANNVDSGTPHIINVRRLPVHDG